MAIPEELSCQELIELVTEYVEGTLPPAERARFERHLNACTGCRHYLDQVRQTIQLVGALEKMISPMTRRRICSVSSATGSRGAAALHRDVSPLASPGQPGVA